MSRDTGQRRESAKPCGCAATRRPTSRRVILGAFLGLGAVTALYGSLDNTAWRAFEAVEEAWIRDRYELLVQQAPAAANAARIDLEVRLADLARRAVQFRHLTTCDPTVLRGGIWQLTALPVSETEEIEMASTTPDYRKLTERVRILTESLRTHLEYDLLQKAQVRLWKTPQYREIHRRYTGRMQELQRLYGSDAVTGGSK